MAASYKSQIDQLADKPIDIAFVPVDPRLEEQYAWGIDYLMKTAEVRNAIPMHFSADFSIVKRLLEDPISLDYRDRIANLAKRGEIVLKNND
jgi:L-ascorbate metabolism protein UlaG (beta-lactamase superfamily)